MRAIIKLSKNLPLCSTQCVRAVVTLSMMFAFMFCNFGAFARADDSSGSPAFKADVPKMDPVTDKPVIPHKPLQAGIQHNAHATTPGLHAGAATHGNKGFLGHLRGGAKGDGGNSLRGNTNQGNFNIAATSGFGIIGVKFVLALGKPPVINRVFAGTPAAQMGLHIDDVIVAVDGVPTAGLSKEEVYDLIIGSPGTPVNLSIMRQGDFQVFSCMRMDINELTDPVVRRDYMMSM